MMTKELGGGIGIIYHQPRTGRASGEHPSGLL